MAQMKGRELLDLLLSYITLPQGWRVEVHTKGDGHLIQIVFDAPDTETGEPKEQRCRKWYVSQHAAPTEIVRTVYKAGLAALEHEFDETFKYQGIAIYNPHLNVNDLVATIEAGDAVEDRRG